MSNAPQTGQFFGVDALARLPDAAVFVVDQILRPDVDMLFPGTVVLGVKGAPKAFDGLKGRKVYVWCIDPEPKLASIGEVAGELIVVGGNQSPAAFLGNPKRVRAHVQANRRSYEAQVAPEAIVEPGRAEKAPDPVQNEKVAEANSALIHLTDEKVEIHDIDEHSLADAFTRAHPDLRYVAAWGRWMEWDRQVWRADSTLHSFDHARAICVQASREATGSAAKKLKSAQARAAVENLARSDRRHAASVDQWDRDPWALNTPGGVIDLKTGQLRAARLEDYATKITSVAPGGACSTWNEFLRAVCDFDDDLVSFLQRVIGYSLTGVTREQCLFFLYGTGANGKGTFLNTLRDIFGDYATVAGMDTFTETKQDRHSQELARLRGARMVCAQETEQGKRWAEARIKALTGGDPITARFMRQDDFEFMPQFKLIIAGNHKPKIRNADEAMRRRLHLIPFTITIAPDKRDQRLGEKLRAEAGGILQWAIDGCLAWQKYGLQPPECVLAATAEYMSSQDMVGVWMDECTQKSTDRTRTSDLYKSYKAWAESQNEYAIRNADFNEWLDGHGHNVRKLNGINFANGLSLKQPANDYMASGDPAF